MKELTFVTGNAAKAEQIARYLDYPVNHANLDLIEIQSLDVKEIIVHKVKEAYSRLKKPVLVEDTSLVFNALGKLPGPLIKWFYKEVGNEGLCRLLDPFEEKSAKFEVNFGYYDGKLLKIFRAVVSGSISDYPKGTGGFGWDPIFMPKGHSITRGEMETDLFDKTSPRPVALKKLRNYLLQIHS